MIFKPYYETGHIPATPGEIQVTLLHSFFFLLLSSFSFSLILFSHLMSAQCGFVIRRWCGFFPKLARMRHLKLILWGPRWERPQWCGKHGRVACWPCTEHPRRTPLWPWTPNRRSPAPPWKPQQKSAQGVWSPPAHSILCGIQPGPQKRDPTKKRTCRRSRPFAPWAGVTRKFESRNYPSIRCRTRRWTSQCPHWCWRDPCGHAKKPRSQRDNNDSGNALTHSLALFAYSLKCETSSMDRRSNPVTHLAAAQLHVLTETGRPVECTRWPCS